MGTKHRILLAALIVVALAVLTWFFLSSNQPPEPVYQGKSLTTWLKESPIFVTVTDVRDAQDNEAVAAISHIGTNAIPTLLQMLRASDSALRAKFIRLLKSQNFIRFNLAEARDRNFLAVEGFSILGTNAAGAVPNLIQIIQKNISVASQRSAISALGSIDESAKSAIFLLRVAANTNSDWRVRCTAFGSINRIGVNPMLATPALTPCLADTNGYVRGWASVVLGNFGTNAKPCVPALLSLLSDPQKLVRDSAGSALKKIDPAAAAKAGVK